MLAAQHYLSSPRMNSGDTSGEEIMNAKPIDSNLNDNFPKFTCYKLWRYISEKEEKVYQYLQEKICPFPSGSFYVHDWTRSLALCI